ncbi:MULTISPECIES: hypothetical protein [unclassified Pseudomonas]|uniref:hypothetical protein n=1 Tax=unclassified Pseudomonas TaxID=196821 RepID=UPI002A36EDB3|nr:MULTISPECIES: hypothetical protein [unclassified Pseudomonas]MDX9669554.1 hypothetical protein [Pseudomonas sp. P8_250]WPN36410.1 hypothetical protein QMK53_01775 [Pseudomonas sp. P8_139]WPN41789.1 hypothetical protein QMK55_01095 [Pseudomonas sp. P8_229]
MENRDVEKLNIDLLRVFGWQVEVAEQDESFGVSGKYLKLYRVTRAGHPDCKKSYVGPMPIDIPDFAIHNAGWLCRDYYLLGYKQGRRDEGQLRRKKRLRHR